MNPSSTDVAELELRGRLQAQPLQADTNQQLMTLLMGAGRLDELEAHALAVLALDPGHAVAWLFLCQVLLCDGRDAVDAGQSAVASAPEDPRAHDCLGVAFKQAGQLERAVASFRRAIGLNPRSAATHARLADTLEDLGRLEEAVEAQRVAVDLDPGASREKCILALMLVSMNRYEEPRALLEALVRERPDFALGHNTLASLHLNRQEWAQAEASARQVIALAQQASQGANAHFTLADSLFGQLRLAEGLAHLDEAVRLAPDNARFRVARFVRALPSVPGTVEEAASAVDAFGDALHAFSAWRMGRIASGLDVESDTVPVPPFLLAYRDGNHVDLLSRFADATGPVPLHTAARSPSSRQRVRLGVVSGHIRRHSAWDVITRGILVNLDRERFEIFLYHTSSTEDTETAFAKSICDRWTDASSGFDAAEWASAIEKDQLDVLFYPELGMDSTTYLIARERLAPVQAVSWGHPITSGISTIDLFFSSDLCEPPDAQSHYRERLVRLPGTGACTDRIPVEAEPPHAMLRALAERPGPTILVPQMPFKFSPGFDEVLVRIVRSLGPCKVAIPVDKSVGAGADRLEARLGRTLRSAGCDPDAVLQILPWQNPAQFDALLDMTDVMLDCPFSGYTTAWKAVHRGTPIVSMTGPQLRHRLATGLHRKIGICDTLAETQDDYVRLAVEVAREGRGGAAGQARREAIRAAAPSADGDVSVVRAFEAALHEALEARGRARAG